MVCPFARSESAATDKTRNGALAIEIQEPTILEIAEPEQMQDLANKGSNQHAGKGGYEAHDPSQGIHAAARKQIEAQKETDYEADREPVPSGGVRLSPKIRREGHFANMPSFGTPRQP
jgi:hypothetical protein